MTTDSINGRGNTALNLSQTTLGIELGSTRIKAVLLDRNHLPLASGSFQWENKLVNGLWTYSLAAVRTGIQSCFADLAAAVQRKFSIPLTTTGAIGISGMMHGYLPFDREGRQLAEFRTWRNTMTGPAAQELTQRFSFNIPQRWSIAHLYQAILNGESHVKELNYLTTLAGYIHWQLTGQRVLGIGEASGMFPIDSTTLDYDAAMVRTFDRLIAPLSLPWKLRDVLPQVLPAGQFAGTLTPQGALLLDPTGTLCSGIPCVPPEGDAGTGMVATNSVRICTGNVSAGTSDFAMIVADRPVGLHREIDMVTTPAGQPVAMVHCNNCTSDINDWAALLAEFAQAIGAPQNPDALFTLLFQKALEGDPDCGGLLSYNYISGEQITNLDTGRPVFLRSPNSRFTLANFMRAHLLSALATLKLGLDILLQEEHLSVTKLYGHGGFFKTPQVGQRILSAATGTEVSVMKTAGEGGPYGMALLCAFALWKKPGEPLEDYLDQQVFAQAQSVSVRASQEEIEGFCQFLSRYRAAFPVERAAAETIKEEI